MSKLKYNTSSSEPLTDINCSTNKTEKNQFDSGVKSPQGQGSQFLFFTYSLSSVDSKQKHSHNFELSKNNSHIKGH